MESNRWWEFYFIRYFVGSVLGTVVVTALVFHPDSGLSAEISNLIAVPDKDVLKLKTDHFWVLLSLGIAFCYIASAPILVFHSLRAQFDFQSNTPVGIGAWIARFLVIAIPLGFLYWAYQSHPITFALLSAYTLVVVFQIIFLVPALKSKFITIFNFYKSLAKDRAMKCEDRKQYIESYKHLREHGNAFLILFCELVLGSALFVSNSIAAALIIIAIWLGPTTPIWFLGTFLESKLKNV